MYNSIVKLNTIRIAATVITHLARLATLTTLASNYVVGHDHLYHVGTSQTGGTDLAAVHPVVLGAGEGGSRIRFGSLGASLALAGETLALAEEIALLLGIASILADGVVDLGGVGREEGRRGDDDERNGRESHAFIDELDRK